MSTIVNDCDILLQAEFPRTLNNGQTKLVLLTATTPVFQVNNSGVPSPASILFTATPLNLPDSVVFSITAGGTLTGTGDTRSLAFTDMSVGTVTVTATVTYDSVDYSSSQTIVQVHDGVVGVTTYTWIKYGTSSSGAGLSDSPIGMTYIGLAVNKTTATESTVATDYSWSLIKGTDGVAGTAGADGVTLYTWIKYSDVVDGTGLYDTPTSSTVYIGIAVNKITATESTLKTDYIWSKFKGDVGVPGTTGTRGSQTFYITGSAWSDAAANAATSYAPILGDTVVISNGGTFALTKAWTGSAWVAPGVVIDGSLLVTGSVTAAKINTNGLVIRDTSGNIILGSGSALDWTKLTASGITGGNAIQNSAITIGSNGALSGGGGGTVSLGGLGYSGSPYATYNPGAFANLSGTITAGNAASYFAANSISGTYITSLAADKIIAGDLNSMVLHGGSGYSDHSTFAWPTNGGYGYHLSSGGLLLGNANSGNKYFEVSADGDIYTVAFTIIGGVMSLNAVNVVNTVNIAGQAVTFPRSAYTQGIQACSNGGWATAQRIEATYTGAPVHILATTVLLSSSVHRNIGLRIYRSDGAVIATFSIGNTSGYNLPYTIQALDASPIGGYIGYYLQIYYDLNGANIALTCQCSALLTLETKR